MKVLFLIHGVFPAGNAFASRAVSICKLLTLMGHQVHVITLRSKTSDIKPGIIREFEKYTYECATATQSNSWESFTGTKVFFTCICAYLKKNNVDCVLYSAAPHDFL